MIYRNVDCPHCGNEIAVNNGKEVQKCRWCKRLVGVKFSKRGKKFNCDVEALSFDKPFDNDKKDISNWEKDDIYGK